jgi:two-component system LytT family sensor kinase
VPPLPNHPLARFLLVQVLAWSALATVVYAASATYLMHAAGALPWQIAVRGAWWAVLGMLLSSALVWPYRRWFAGPSPLTPPRLLLVAACSIAAGLTFALLFDASVWPLPEEGMAALRAAKSKSVWARAISPSLAMLAWSATWVGASIEQRLQAERERALAAERLAVEARLAMLRYELNPHFLFNALNSVVGAIDESPARAKQMVRQLAELLRHSLQGSRSGSTLAEELEVARLYLALEQARFEENLQIELEVSPEVTSWPMPSMLLQPLVENAVKHGMRTGGVPLRVTLRATQEGGQLRVSVTNNGRLQARPADPNGVGLRNLRDRLVHLDGATFELRQQGERVEAVLGLGR